MKHIKRLISLFLALALTCGYFVTASAETTTEAYVGILTIFSSPPSSSSASSVLNLGHAFLSFKNTSSNPILIGALEVGRGQEITFGTWQNGRHGHDGIWYNLESYCINHKGEMSNRVSKSMNVTMNNVATINYMIRTNDSWDYFTNCSTFASAVWDSISEYVLTPLGVDTPNALARGIKCSGDYTTNRPVANSSPYGYLKTTVVDGVTSVSFVSVNPSNILVSADTNTVSVIDETYIVTLDNPCSVNEEV